MNQQMQKEAEISLLEQAEERIRKMAIENARLRNDLAVVKRMKFREDPTAKAKEVIEQAHADALTLAATWAAGLPVSRRYAPIPERRWHRAVGLALLANVWQQAQGFTESEFPVLVERLGTGRQRALADPSRFLTRLPTSRTLKRFYPRW